MISNLSTKAGSAAAVAFRVGVMCVCDNLSSDLVSVCTKMFFSNFGLARSRLYETKILRQNMRLGALFKLYTLHTFEPVQSQILTKNVAKFNEVR